MFAQGAGSPLNGLRQDAPATVATDKNRTQFASTWVGGFCQHLEDRPPAMNTSPEFFPDTRWSLIQSARAEDGAEALEAWARGYHAPIRTYINSRVKDDELADELTQEFFYRLLKRGPGAALPERGEGAFRAYLMLSIRNFLTDHWRHAQRQKRGGGVAHVDADAMRDLADREAAGPNRTFDQSWAYALIEIALSKLSQEMRAKGKDEFFQALKPYLGGRRMTEEVRADLMRKLKMNESHLRVSLHRLRGRFRQAIEAEIRETVATEAEFQEEKCYLLSLWT